MPPPGGNVAYPRAQQPHLSLQATGFCNRGRQRARSGYWPRQFIFLNYNMSQTTPELATAAEEEWDMVIRARSGWFNLHLQDLWHYRDLLSMFVWRDFVAVYKQTILGPIWFFIQPLLLVYSRCGEARPACVRCSAIRGCDGAAEACCLLFGWENAEAAKGISSSDAPSHDDDGGQAAAAPSRVGAGGLARLVSRPVRSQTRALHNFRVGLEIQREVQRAAAAFGAVP